MKRILSSFLICSLVLSIVIMYSPKAYAFPGNYFWFPKNMHVRIYHPSSGMFLGIDRNGKGINGARLQLQRYEEGNQDQIFYLKAINVDSNGHTQYQIRVHGEHDKIIEIRDSSHKDYAEAAQWQTHDGDCAKWYFFTKNNRNGCDSATCCIKNVESGKMLNVEGNRAYDGNNLIQYHEDGTKAEIFQIFSVENDISGALWHRDWGKNQEGGLYWSMTEDTEANRQKYYTPINIYKNGKIYYPVQHNKNVAYLATVVWADPNLQKEFLQKHNQPKTAKDQIWEAYIGIKKESFIDKAFSYTPFKELPMGDIKGIIETIMEGQNEQQWYIMEKAFQKHTNVRIEIYYVFESGIWGVNCKTLVNDSIDTYWDGDKSSINSLVNMNYSNTWIEGSVEYFYK